MQLTHWVNIWSSRAADSGHTGAGTLHTAPSHSSCTCLLPDHCTRTAAPGHQWPGKHLISVYRLKEKAKTTGHRYNNFMLTTVPECKSPPSLLMKSCLNLLLSFFSVELTSEHCKTSFWAFLAPWYNKCNVFSETIHKILCGLSYN